MEKNRRKIEDTMYITVGNQGYTLNGKEQAKDVRYYITVGDQGSNLNGKDKEL